MLLMINTSFALCEKCPHSELFPSVFYRIYTEYGEILRTSPYSVRMRENKEQNNSEYGHFSRSVVLKTKTKSCVYVWCFFFIFFW